MIAILFAVVKIVAMRALEIRNIMKELKQSKDKTSHHKGGKADARKASSFKKLTAPNKPKH